MKPPPGRVLVHWCRYPDSYDEYLTPDAVVGPYLSGRSRRVVSLNHLCAVLSVFALSAVIVQAQANAKEGLSDSPHTSLPSLQIKVRRRRLLLTASSPKHSTFGQPGSTAHTRPLFLSRPLCLGTLALPVPSPLPSPLHVGASWLVDTDRFNEWMNAHDYLASATPPPPPAPAGPPFRDRCT